MQKKIEKHIGKLKKLSEGTILPVIPVFNKNIFERRLNLLIFRNNLITLSSVQNTNHKARFEY